MAFDIDTKFEGKLTCASKNDMWNLANFQKSTWKSQNWDFYGILLSKVQIHELKIHRGVMCYDNEDLCKIWKGIDLSIQNWHEEFDEFSPEHSKISKICTLMSCFWPKYIVFQLKKYRGVMFDGIEDWCKIWRKTDLCFQKWH